eukprot:TRINITY_DN1283_c0_g1_i1.p1 TRINITY_DN1283_c0_g1~~TRINITY_DN1283_c0_g1_i1.p1  ORF type:complete len:1013 (+),score=153.69 TRINITY_DN1283_c0_g1_i1:97-3039(+)
MKAFYTSHGITTHTFYTVEGGDQVPTTEGMKMQETGLIRLMYVSRSFIEIPKEELSELAKGFAVRNMQIGITGFLIYSPPLFFQTIEGREEDIMFLYNKISRDPRHTDCAIIQKTPAFHRLYSNWHMKDSHIDDISNFSPLKLVLGRLGQATPAQRFLSPATIETLLSGGDPIRTPPTILNAVVFFAGIYAFDTLFHHPVIGPLTPYLMTRFADICTRSVVAHGGRMLKLHGSTVLCVFTTLQADAAVRCCVQVQAQLAELREKHVSHPLSCLYGTIALNFGQLVLLNLGSKRSDFTVLGDTVNTTSRLLKLASSLDHSVVLSLNVRKLLAESWELNNLGDHSVKGKEVKIHVFAPPSTPFSSEQAVEKITAFNIPLRKEEINNNPITPFDKIPKADQPPIFRDAWSRRSSLMPGGIDVDSSLVVLTYISEARTSLTSAEVDQLAALSDKRNQQNDISGVLMFTSRFFIQTIEGRADKVRALYQRITLDHRHTNCVLVQLESITQRRFPSWYMMTNALEAIARFPPLEAVVAQLCHIFMSIQTYLPSPVVRTLQRGRSPLEIQPVRTNAVVFVTDLVGFTTISERSPIHEVTKYVSTFIDVCTSRLLRHGEVMKFVGDCVIAYYSPESVRHAFQAAVDINADICALRAAALHPEDLNAEMLCGMSIAFGEVVICNIGTEFIDYCLMGDAYSTALATEGVTRTLRRSLLLTKPAYDLLPDSIQPLLEPLGEHPVGPNGATEKIYAPIGRQFFMGQEQEDQAVWAKKSLKAVDSWTSAVSEEDECQPFSAPLSRSPSGLPLNQVRVLRHARTQNSLLKSVSANELVFRPAPQPGLRTVPAMWYKIACLRSGVVPNVKLLASLEAATGSEVLVIDCSNPPVVGRSGLAAALDTLSNLRVEQLILRGNDLDDASVASIVAACVANPDLKVLDLRDNPNIVSGTVLRDLVSNSPSLRSVLLDNTRVPSSDRRYIAQACERRAAPF